MKQAERGDRSATIPVRRLGWFPFVRLAVLSIVLAGSLSVSQTKRPASKPNEFELPPEEEKSALGIVQPTSIALESTVNPEDYFVGPSDILSVNIWMSPPASFPLIVSPEGTLLIPTVGEVMVADLTLARAKEKIVAEIRKKYLHAEITATLIKPRPIVVNIAGNVLHPGLLTLTGADRVNKALEEANKLSRLQTQDDLSSILRVMSTRKIVIKHRDGSQARADIPKYSVTHDNRWNPYLREGDQVVVPNKNYLTGQVAVYGQINSPGRFEFVEGDSVLDLIRFGQGMTDRALAEQVIFSRMNEDGKSLSTRIIDIPGMMAGREPNIALKPGDRIIIQQESDARGDYNVDIGGEVVHPGTYPITVHSTHLSEMIRQAGGFTDAAALSSAEVSRQPVNPENVEHERLLSLRGEPAGNDSGGYSLETELRIKRAPVAVDFEKLFLQRDSTEDIILQAEDQIFIPSRQKTVYVFGQVVIPGHIVYVRGRDPKYYIEKAGGYTSRANSGSLKVIKAKTKQWLEPGSTTIEEGDYLWVPQEPDRPFSYYMTIASQSAAVLSVIIGIAFIVQQSNK